MKKLVLLTLLVLYSYFYSQAQDKKLIFSGFSEFRYETHFGKTANETQQQLFENSGGDEELWETNHHLYYPGFNINILSELNENLFFQGELNFEPEDSEGLVIDIFRAYLDYQINSKFNIQVGKFLSPIGYLNRNQRIYGYLNNSVRPRDMVWEENGYIPGFTLGIQLYGAVSAGGSAVRYYAAYGANRHIKPFGDQIALGHIHEEDDTNPGFSGILEYFLSTPSREISIGLSGYINPRIITNFVELGEEFDESSPVPIEFEETGFAPYFKWDDRRFQFFTEFHNIKFVDIMAVSGGKDYLYRALSSELMYKSKLDKKPFGTYVRYDMRTTTEEHPFYGLGGEGEELIHTYVPDQSELMVGVVWDIFANNRTKIEYGFNFNGVVPVNRISVSTSFAF